MTQSRVAVLVKGGAINGEPHLVLGHLWASDMYYIICYTTLVVREPGDLSMCFSFRGLMSIEPHESDWIHSGSTWYLDTRLD
jgi:hypothetical protein